MLFEVGGQNRLDDEETEALELHVFKVHQEVVLGSRHEEVPGCSCVVVFQDGPVVVQNSLKRKTINANKYRVKKNTNFISLI